MHLLGAITIPMVLLFVLKKQSIEDRAKPGAKIRVHSLEKEYFAHRTND